MKFCTHTLHLFLIDGLIDRQRFTFGQFVLPNTLDALMVASRWAPTRCKWGYSPYKWPYSWVTGVITRMNGVTTPFITGRCPLCLPHPQQKHQ